MYHKLFDQKKQDEMREFFLELSKKGKLKKVNNSQMINLKSRNKFAIVVQGKLKQSLYSKNGAQKSLFILQSGEIFGEMDYFSCGKNNIMTQAMEKSIIAVVTKTVLENELKKDAKAYRYFLHSVTRKFRIVMLQMSGLVFNDSIGKLSEILLRLSSQQGKKVDNGILIDFKLTHEEIASLIGCSRATVTKGLNKLKEENLITIINKKVIVKDISGLEKYIDPVFCDN